MQISQFVNPPEDVPLHDSGLTAQSRAELPAMQGPQSFSQRQEIEQRRTIVGSYADSFLGHQVPARRELGHYKKKDRAHVAVPKREQGLERSRHTQSVTPPPAAAPKKPSSSFREPPARGYNPYG